MKNVSDSSLSLPNLLCQEDESCFTEMNLVKQPLCVPQSDDDYLQTLFEKESIFISNDSDCSEKWLKCARLDAINWTLNVCFRFIYLLLLFFVLMDF